MQNSQFSFSNFKTSFVPDLSASLVVFLVALPLCMGIAMASGLPPASGLLAGIGILIVIQQFHVVLDRTPEHSGLANIGAMWSAVFGGLFPLNGSKEELAALLGVITLAI